MSVGAGEYYGYCWGCGAHHAPGFCLTAQYAPEPIVWQPPRRPWQPEPDLCDDDLRQSIDLHQHFQREARREVLP